MPRISKRKKNAKSAASVSKGKTYRVGIYARLSSDIEKASGNTSREESLESQVAIAKSHMETLKKQGERMELFEVYSDLGKTGTNFNRDAFTRMLQDVRMGDVDCVMVKDLSRFGRNYLEAGNYIENIFSFLGVRFIAVSDGFDTGKEGNESKKIAMNIKNLVNDMYAKDASQKAKIHIKQKREMGSFIGGPTPYGFTYEWQGKVKTLVPDENTSKIVRLIFRTFVEERSYAAVLRVLNKMRVNPPTVYRKTNAAFCPMGEPYKSWAQGYNIARILENVAYMGSLAQGKATSPNEQWVTKEDCHEGIIDKATFDQAQEAVAEIRRRHEARNKRAELVPLEYDIYKGFLLCGRCGRKLTRISHPYSNKSGQSYRYESYCCMNSHENHAYEPCESNRIGRKDLDEILACFLKTEFSLFLNRPKAFLKGFKEKAGENRRNCEKKLAVERNRLERLEEEESKAYISYCSGETTQSEYVSLKLQNSMNLEEAQRQQAELKATICQVENELAKFEKVARELLNLKKEPRITRELLGAFIAQIHAYPGKRVEIVYAFANAGLDLGKEVPE